MATTRVAELVRRFDDTPLSADEALRQVELITGLGVGVSSLEFLSNPRFFDETQLLGWETARTRHRWMAGKIGDLITPLMTKPGIQVVLTLRALCAAIVVSPFSSRRAKNAATAYLMATSYLLHLRTPYGSDGSEHMATITLTSLTLSRLFGSDERAKEACLRFIAAQSTLSYATAGLAKAVSPVWRNGTAVRDIFRTRMYGHKWVHRLLSDHPPVAKALGYATIAGELLFPAVLVAPKPVAQAVLGMGTSFHAGNAIFMGLNRFLWAFTGTYPAVRYVSRSLGRGAKRR